MQTPLADRSSPRPAPLWHSATRGLRSTFVGTGLWPPLAVACLAALLLVLGAAQPARAATGLGQLSDPFVIAAPQAEGLTLTESAGVQTLVFDPAQLLEKVSSYFAEAHTEFAAFDVQGKEQQFTAVQWSYSAPGDRGAWNIFVSYSLDGINWFNAGSGQTPNDQANVALQTIDLLAHGHRIQFVVRFTLNTPAAQASPPPLVTLPAPVTLWDIRVWHKSYIPPKKSPTKKPTKKPSQSHTDTQQTAQTTGGGSGSGNGYGQGGGSGTGAGSGNGTGSSSTSGRQTTQASGSGTAAVTAPASTSGVGGTWVNGFRVASLQAPAETGASASGGSGGSAATASAAPAGPSLFVLLGLIALAALVAPGPIVARRLHRVASFDHVGSTAGTVTRS